MDEHGLQLLEVTSFSTTVADAVHNALVSAAPLLPHIQWVEKGDIHEIFDQGQQVGWQVTLRIGLCCVPAPSPSPI
jgi:flavin-binding protein dodecin